MSHKAGKDWSEIKSNDSWAIFKIMAEFVNGYENMARIGPSISVFGSARTQAHQDYYQKAVNVSRLLAERGYGVITGGGDRKSTRLNSSHVRISYAVFCLKKKKKK